MRKLERLLQIHIATMVGMAAIMLGLGQNSVTLPAIVIFAAASSIIFTDWLQWFALNRVLANLAAIVALVVSLGDYLDGGSENQLLAIANLLIYLQIVLFYQRKNDRLYWQLTVLSLLQVVVAAAMNVGLEFGALLLVYMVVTFSSLAIFFIYRETKRLATTAPPGNSSHVAPAVDNGDKLPTAWRHMLAGRNLALTTQNPSLLVHQFLGWRFIRQVAVMGLATLVFTVVMFYTLPRRGMVRRPNSRTYRSIVGFSKEVMLDEMREILQSPEPVMRVSYREGDVPYEIRGEQYYRGTVLARYISNQVPNRSRAGWRALMAPHKDYAYPQAKREEARAWQGWSLSRSQPSDSLVLAEYVLEPSNDAILFCGFPVSRVRETPDEIRYVAILGQLRRKARPESMPAKQYRYVLGTSGYRNGFQPWIIPHEMNADSKGQKLLMEYEQYRLRFYPPLYQRWFPQLTRIAGEIAQAERDGGADTIQVARALQNHFRAGQYTYSLDFTKLADRRNRKIDPIEDFVSNHRTGHCEYFASALVMMLRSQGIPARLVVGYKGGEYNSVGNYYQIRSLHAHAWVEAHLSAEEAREYVRPGLEVGEAGAWLRLDPTPATGRSQQVRAEGGVLAKVDETLDYAQLLWYEYVMDLNPEQHEQLATRTSTALGDFLDDPSWAGMMRVLRDKEESEEAARTGWINWRFVVVGLVSLFILLLLFRAVLVGLLMLARMMPRRTHSANHSSRPRVDFYLRFEQLLARFGLKRQPSQTQREFADWLAQHWARTLMDDRRDSWVDQVVSAYYRVRFGGASLDNGEVQEIEHALSQLELSLSGPATEEASGHTI